MIPVIAIKGVGESVAKLLSKIGIESVDDLIENIPRKYDDYSHVTDIGKVGPGPITVQAKIHSIKGRYAKKGLHITEAVATDSTGSLRIMWFNQPFRANSIKEGEEYYLSGEYAQNYRFLVLSNPTIELVSTFPLHTARLVPQYKLTKGLGAHQLRRFTKEAFESTVITESLPAWLIKEKNLMNRRDSLFQMHFPKTISAVSDARRRLGFEEIFTMAIASELNRADFAREEGLHIPFQEKEVVSFVKSLPYMLTDDQRKCTWQILQDMTKGSPMNRLLQGDVGSGKTAVASIAMVNAAIDGFQAAFMAPTEVLASQHAQTIISLLPEKLKESVVLLSGSMSKSQKVNARAAIETGKGQIIIGTHALIQDEVIFNNLGLVVIDEQHRFGVEQRKLLQAKAKIMPHVLHMTATPIPRSIALTLYGDLDISVLKSKPSNRLPITTKIYMPDGREQLYRNLLPELENGRQIFVVCPLIEEVEKRAERTLSVNTIAKQIEKWLVSKKVVVLHGKMKSEEKDAIMASFKDRDIDILVSTTVIEVGVDVPNATVMVVEGADRFGLAQLHQLRGRVGRGEHKGMCYLVTTTNDQPSRRLRMIEQEYDGFKLADYDLELRGPGAIYGTSQHGVLDLRVAKITDIKLIAEAREAARAFMKKGENLVQYPQLKTRVDRLRTITNLN